MEFLKGFDLSLWWNKLIAVGLAIIVAALAAQERGLIVVALGMIAVGFGEGLNHRMDVRFTEPSAYLPQHMITSYPRIPRPLGVALDIAGGLLMAFGLYRLLAA